MECKLILSPAEPIPGEIYSAQITIPVLVSILTRIMQISFIGAMLEPRFVNFK